MARAGEGSYFEEAQVPKQEIRGEQSAVWSALGSMNSAPLELYLVKAWPEILNIDIPAIM